MVVRAPHPNIITVCFSPPDGEKQKRNLVPPYLVHTSFDLASLLGWYCTMTLHLYEYECKLALAQRPSTTRRVSGVRTYVLSQYYRDRCH